MKKLIKNFVKKLNIITDESEIQDVTFLVGIFVIISLLIIALFPGRNAGNIMTREFFIYAVMTVPVIAALYFIVISFQKNLYTENWFLGGASIRKKMALAFVFVAILPTLPAIITSNYVVHKTLPDMIIDRISKALQEAIDTSNEPLVYMHDSMHREMEGLKYQIRNGSVVPQDRASRDGLRALYRIRGYAVLVYEITRDPDGTHYRALDIKEDELSNGFGEFFEMVPFKSDIRVDKLALGKSTYLAGALSSGNTVIVLCSTVREEIPRRIEFYAQSMSDHRRIVQLVNNFKNNIGMYLFAISLVIIVISVLLSLYLSKNIVKPVLELSNAASEIADGNFNISLHREAKDELGQLYISFNRMVKELDRNRKLMYQKERLEAWREMARRLVHEIKNPLTPIQLSAERMKKRYQEKHPKLDEIIVTGADTIVEEVQVLMNILSQFTKFARLPEMHPVKTDIRSLIENCVTMFSSHENISFSLELDERIPEIPVDRVLIRQTLNNLMQNAVESISGKGSISVKAEYLKQDAKGIVRISIRDTGSGIKKSDRDRVFAPGYSTKPTGTGLGLAIVQKIIMEHGGEISFESEKGKGTEFIIELPAGQRRG